jgi:dUTP pyrophosphatase
MAKEIEIRTGNGTVKYKIPVNEIAFEYVSRVLEQNNKFSLPIKGSKNAAGYDFINPEEVTIQPKEIKYVKTGIKALFPDDIVLLLFNRSSNPKKKGLILINGVGVVDADYYDNEDNEGEIAFAFYNITDNLITIEKGEKLGQGMFTVYANVTGYNSEAVNERKGGFGSTGE